MSKCVIAGCTDAARCRGWCDKHYTRWRRHGHPLRAIRPFDVPVAERFWEKVEKTDGCWLWTAALDPHGYGRFGLPRPASPRVRMAHRLAYEWAVGPIPEDTELDHLCRTPACVRPSHLEPVTHDENVKRGAPFRKRPTHCPHGHPYSPENTYTNPKGKRRCRICGRAATVAWMRRKKLTPPTSFV